MNNSDYKIINKAMDKYIAYLESLPTYMAKEEARKALVKTGVIDEEGNLRDIYKDHDPYLS